MIAGDKIAAAEFAKAISVFDPFEPKPLVAVGVSGGPDSMALTLLLDRWARGLDGSVLGLTVDHGLRPDSAAEARQVGVWLAARGIPHAVLPWTGDKPESGIQQAARAARYALLAEACASRGILHLAVAHHAGDQAETVLFRRRHGSGADGLAGMPAKRILGAVRLLRPLLAWPKNALVATCEAFHQPFFDDPSNRAPRFARTGLRQELSVDATVSGALVREAAAAGHLRAQRERSLAALLGRIAEVRPDGTVIFDRVGLSAAAGLRHMALATALRMVGGSAYAPDAEAVARLDFAVQTENFPGAGLGGCLVRLWRGRLVICREPARATTAMPLPAGEWRRWDRRFLMRTVAPGLEVRALGRAGYAAIRRKDGTPLPAVAAAGLPAIARDGELLAVPGLDWAAPGAPAVEQIFSPVSPLLPEIFTVVCAAMGIICGNVGRVSAVQGRT